MAGTATLERRNSASFGKALARPFVAFGNFLVHLAEANAKVRAIDELNRMSDRQLAERGLTREDEIRRIVGAASYL
ncbi:DUF1127 domain-containing protein [Paracoccus sp. (in: a-proteobacteria)]|uniref:DUF1127 domain-containing protein n=1 Tax=Paracoccus sp. TaxID=267 RepID=UPI003A8773A9